jgi:RNA polymerase sigma factor (sigma-70 family)
METKRLVADIVQSAAEGDGGAMEELLRRFQPLLRSTARRYSVRDAEDLAQELAFTFVLAVRRFHAGKGVYFEHYIRQILLGAAWTWVRREQRHRGRTLYTLDTVRSGADGEGEMEPLLHAVADPRAHDSFETAWLEEMLDGLTGAEKVVARRVLLDGDRVTEVAEDLGVTRSTAATWKRRGLAKLRQTVRE